jgi:LysR family transcriptional regulator, hydrogen peroxide-inducible genes activator
MITLKQLRYFESLSRHLHFGRAAEQSAVTQPAMSQQVQELEAQLGTKLVERGKTAVSLTDAGQEVARRARSILASVSDLADYARHRGKLLSGSLKLGVIPSIGPYLLPVILPELKQHFPELELSVRESQTGNLLAALAENRIDVALLALGAAAPGFEQIALFDDPFHLLVPARHRLGRAKSIRINELDGERVLLLEEGHCLRDQALSLCRRVGLEASTEFGATSLSTIVQLVSNGYGITVVPEMALPVEAHDQVNLRVTRFVSPEPVRTIGLIWRETSPRKVDFIELGRLISQVCRGTGADV